MGGVDPSMPPPSRSFDPAAPRSGSRRILWHALGLLVAALVAWLILRGYRQPDFLLDISNMRLC
jgi:hypothetical protein